VKNPIIEEIHQARLELYNECEGDIDKMLAILRKRSPITATSTGSKGKLRLRTPAASVPAKRKTEISR
jgi:hypothetical protein